MYVCAAIARNIFVVGIGRRIGVSIRQQDGDTSFLGSSSLGLRIRMLFRLEGLGWTDWDNSNQYAGALISDRINDMGGKHTENCVKKDSRDITQHG